MTNAEILKKALEKAEKGGWTKDKSHLAYLVSAADKNAPEFPYWIRSKSQAWQSFRHETVIFSHDFAKAFWGELEGCSLCHQPKVEIHGCMDQFKSAWKYHLQKMVLEEDPIKYLEKFL